MLLALTVLQAVVLVTHQLQYLREADQIIVLAGGRCTPSLVLMKILPEYKSEAALIIF